MGRVALSVRQHLIEQARQADLPDLLASRGWHLKREGRDYRIPGHGGLTLWQDDAGLWRWTWFSRGKGGDAISFLMEFEGLSFREAIEVLSGERWPESSLSVRPNRKLEPPRTDKPNPQGEPKKWQEKAEAFAKWAHEQLVGPEGEPIRKWLAEERGIDEETAREFKLGFNPRTIYQDRKAWGLLLGGRDKLWLPPGLVIPRFDSSRKITGITIRLFKTDEAERYNLPALESCKVRYYSVPSPFKREIWAIGKVGSPLVIVESELDLILLFRYADDCSVAAFGSAGRKPKLGEHFDFWFLFLTAPAVLLALDNDEAGRKASEWWTERYRHVLYWPTTQGKDPAELWKIGNDEAVRRWLAEGLERAETLAGKDWQTLDPIKRAWFFIEIDRLARPIPSETLSQLADEEVLERFSIMSVCGGLSDEEAFSQIRLRGV